MKPDGLVLRASEHCIRTVPLALCRSMVIRYHYAAEGSKTATFRHGLYRQDDQEQCLGVAWWIPPTKGAAKATWPVWEKVLSLSRLVIRPEAPKNAATYLLMQSVRTIRRDPRWECLVTYADTWQGHTGGIYRAAGWEYCGLTGPEAVFVDGAGRMISRKAGDHTRTLAEMEHKGFRCVGRFPKHKYRLVL